MPYEEQINSRNMYERVEQTPHILEEIHRGAEKFKKGIERVRYVNYHLEKEKDMK